MIASEKLRKPRGAGGRGHCFHEQVCRGVSRQAYYGGCEFADVVENLARDRAKQLFGAEHVNVQPHSGSQANAAAYMTLLTPGIRFWGSTWRMVGT